MSMIRAVVISLLAVSSLMTLTTVFLLTNKDFYNTTSNLIKAKPDSRNGYSTTIINDSSEKSNSGSESSNADIHDIISIDEHDDDYWSRPTLKSFINFNTSDEISIVTNINESYSYPDLSPTKNPWTESDYEPASVKPLVRASDTRRVKAALISLVRNEELNDLLSTMSQIEDKFNKKFNYQWIFFNDEDFTQNFKDKTAELAAPAKCTYVKIADSDWEEPEWIDLKKAELLASGFKKEVQYSDKPSYHRMCRWNSGIFFNDPAMRDLDWYWRVEPKTKYYCDIDYDVFAYMEDNDKDYGFNINLYDAPQSVATLWPTTVEFFANHTDYVHPNSARGWLIQDSRQRHYSITQGYSTCHFWSNFEIGRLDFFRSQEYTDFFKYLDRAGGFFYERWGDAPVHSIALGLMTDKSRIHFFRDIGYNHIPYFNCHNSPKCSGCTPGLFAEVNDLKKENCITEWFKIAGDN